MVVEGYPALVARRLIGKRAYKSDERGKQSEEQREARREMVDKLRSGQLREAYALTVELPGDIEQSLIEDAMGDRMDAVLCAAQAGWAYLERERGYGLPFTCDKDEGWIVDH